MNRCIKGEFYRVYFLIGGDELNGKNILYYRLSDNDLITGWKLYTLWYIYESIFFSNV